MISHNKLKRQGEGAISVRNVTLAFNDGATQVLALRDLSLEVEPGEFICVIGPSGCGKSTLLGAAAGFIRPIRGEVRIDDHTVHRPGADRGMVFQQHALFPWKNVLDNIEFGLRMRGVSRTQRRAKGFELLELVGLNGFGKCLPAQLSGGMQQRVGIARALANNPSVLLMDEPFGSLDALTRLKMQELLLKIWQELRTTVIFVTHDVDEAIFLSTRVVMLTARPACVREILPVNLARPRSVNNLTDSEFMKVKHRCLVLLREESAPRREPAASPDIVFGTSGVAWKSPPVDHANSWVA